jgi:hypothetical protein
MIEFIAGLFVGGIAIGTIYARLSMGAYDKGARDTLNRIYGKRWD